MIEIITNIKGNFLCMLKKITNEDKKVSDRKSRTILI